MDQGGMRAIFYQQMAKLLITKVLFKRHKGKSDDKTRT